MADLNFIYIAARILEFLNPDFSRASLVKLRLQTLKFPSLFDYLFCSIIYFYVAKLEIRERIPDPSFLR